MLNSQNGISISLAVRATSVALTYFLLVNWEGLVFWDGGLLNNNPINQLWYGHYDLVTHKESEPPISCIISLGTGDTTIEQPSSWFKLLDDANSVVSLATNTKAKDKDFSRYMSNLNQ